MIKMDGLHDLVVGSLVSSIVSTMDPRTDFMSLYLLHRNLFGPSVVIRCIEDIGQSEQDRIGALSGVIRVRLDLGAKRSSSRMWKVDKNTLLIGMKGRRVEVLESLTC